MGVHKRFVRHITSVTDATIANVNRTHVPIRSPRAALLSELRHVGRVHSPEADMRPLLPLRHLLLKSVTKNSEPSREYHQKKHPHPPRARTGLALLCHQSAEYATSGDIQALSRVIRHTMEPDYIADRSTSYRAVTINAVLGATRAQSPLLVDTVMNILTSHGMLDALSASDVGAVLDVLIRDKLRRNDLPAAFRGELMSRALDTRVSTGTYARLIAQCHRLDAALSLLHRAVAMSATPTVSMLNRVLDLCFQAGDGERARRVVAEMALRDIPPNLQTVSTLVQRADSVDAIDAVFNAVLKDVKPRPDLATIFLRAYMRVGGAAADDAYVGRCFAIIDWCFENAIGVRRHALDELVLHFSRQERVEAALRAWREMRRGWLGSPSLRSKRALWVRLVQRGSNRDIQLRKRLANGVPDAQLRKMHRAVLGQLNNGGRDSKAFIASCVKNKATVLHRMARTGRVHDVHNWINERVEESNGEGIDVRLLMSVLSDTGDSRIDSLGFFLKHLSSGLSVCGEKDVVLKRVIPRLWQWLASVSSDSEATQTMIDEGVTDEEVIGEFSGSLNDGGDEGFHGGMTRKELHWCLVDLVKVSSEGTVGTTKEGDAKS